jgi:hypothetical protein
MWNGKLLRFGFFCLAQSLNSNFHKVLQYVVFHNAQNVLSFVYPMSKHNPLFVKMEFNDQGC